MQAKISAFRKQVFLGLVSLRLQVLQMVFALRSFFFVAFCNDLLFRDTPHFGKNLAHRLINDLIQNVDGISRLPGAVGLLAELSVTGIANTQRIV